MGLFLIYTLKVAICLLLFCAFNKLVLGKDTFHTFNRIAWLSVAVISLLLPLVEWYEFEPISVDLESVTMSSVTTDTSHMVVDLSGQRQIDIFGIVRNILIVYTLFATLLFLKLSLSYIRLFAFILPKRRLHPDDKKYYTLLEECKESVGIRRKIHFIVHNEAMSPFSWMSYIVVSREDLDENGKDILIHELAHSKHLHSYDLLLADLLIIFQWFNPAAWLYKESLQQVHEYKADELVLECGINAKQYQLLLIKKAVGQRLYSMANSFNHSKLKNRITMMLKEKSNKWAFAKCLYALPLAFIAVSAFASDEVSTRLEDVSSVKFTTFSENNDVLEGDNVKKDSTSFVSVQATENIPKAISEDFNKLKNRVTSEVMLLLKKEYSNHPELAKVGKVQGHIIVDYMVEQDGTIVNISITHSSIESLSDEVIRIIKSSPKWAQSKQSGRIEGGRYSFPIIFSTEKSADGTKVEVRPLISVSTKPSAKAVRNESMFVFVENMPKFQGGDLSKFRNEITPKVMALLRSEYVKHPDLAKVGMTQGNIVIEFVVEEDGTIEDVSVNKTPIESLSDDIIRIIKSSPKWTPGRQSGKTVRVKYTLPILFGTKKISEDAEVQVRPAIVVSAKPNIKAGVKGKSALEANKLEESKKDTPFIVVEKMPKFKGGDLSKFRGWVMSKVTYPEQAVKSKSQGVVMVEFVIETNGAIGAIVILQSPDASLSDEVVRIIKSSPKWTPGTQGGKSVRVKFTLPVRFKLPSK